ncbi:MAG: 50S ribosomal protein L6 [Ruminococcaceae bacterium]|nr:50S ribosomal protein L6 [Oscillospiraceae bacterium]
MSRIGRMPISVPNGVEVKINPENEVIVKGPKGTLTKKLHKDMIIKQDNGTIVIERPSEVKEHRSLHGLTRTLLANMVTGVTDGYQKTLEINGVGYRAQKQGNKIVLNLGYSHPVEFEDTADYKLEVPNPNTIVVSGIDKQIVGEIAAKIREKRLPEPYKGKGIKYADEVIRRKEGKTGAKK